jgi:hypothetical protein
MHLSEELMECLINYFDKFKLGAVIFYVRIQYETLNKTVAAKLV